MQIINSREELLAKAREYNNVLVFGAGNIGRTLVRFLIKPENNIVPCGIVRFNKNIKAKKIKDIKVAKLQSYRKYRESALVIVAVVDELKEKAENRLQRQGFENYVAITYDLYLSMSWEENVKMDFMCPSFAKCATTTLNQALKKNKKIFLSKQKETNYMHWRHRFDDSPERFKTMYYSDFKEGQIVGNFEPSYARKSLSVYECFGPDMKLIFMMRNPASATYSYFKMMMRRTQFKKQLKYYLKFNRFDVSLFDNYMEDYVVTGKENRFSYDEIINDYLKYWPKENVHFVIFEELLQDTERVLNEVQEFIGVEPVKITKLPSANVGTRVSKNFVCFLLNSISFIIGLRVKGIPSKKVKKWYNDFNAKLNKITLVENNEKMTEEQRKKTIAFYMDSIKNVEKLTGRSLEGIWY